MRGMEKIIACRKAGRKPILVSVWIGFDAVETDPEQFDLILPSASASADLRPLVGLFVTVFAKNYSPSVLAMWDRMQQFISFGTLKCSDWDDPDSIILFSKTLGQATLSEWSC